MSDVDEYIKPEENEFRYKLLKRLKEIDKTLTWMAIFLFFIMLSECSHK